MLNDRTTRTTFIVSLTVHFLLLAAPQFNLNLSKIPRPEEIIAQIEIEKVSVLQKINITGEEKKLKQVTEEFKQIEPLPELKPEELVMEEPFKEPIEEKKKG